jgi:hypothetical protein
MTFDPEWWRKYLLQTGDYERYQLEVAKALATHPHAYYVGHVEHLKTMLLAMAESIRELPRDRLLWILKTSNAYAILVFSAQRKDWKAYWAIRRSNEDEVIHEMESMRRSLMVPRAVEMDWHKRVEQILGDMDEGLNLYQSGIRYYDSLASASSGSRQGGGFDQAEARVATACGDASVLLGDEYRHIRNAFGHKTVRIIDAKRSISFRDRNPGTGKVWTAEYTMQSLLKLYSHLSDWVIAKGLAGAFEGLATNSIMAKATKGPTADR